VEENTNTVNTEQTPELQQTTEKKVVLQPGQDKEDELDFMGAGLIGKRFQWVKNLFQPKKVE
jgi:hypothetical protein